MRTPTRIAVAAAAVLVLALAAVLLAGGEEDDGPAVAGTPDQRSQLVRDDSRVLGEEGDGGVTVVEFLDFECEACGAAYPVVEDLREQYAGRVTFVIRYFPLPGHVNAERAARAVEAAARQGELEAMYRRMYETQAQWGEQQVPLDALFRRYAEELGLDLARYDADYGSAQVLERVRRDVADGTALGVSSTPTFFVDGQPFRPRSVGDFVTALDAALAE